MLNYRETNISGFSLVEVMIVVAIIGIVASFVIRVMFAPELVAWENSFWSSLVLNQLLLGSLLVYRQFVYGVAWHSRKETRENGKVVIAAINVDSLYPQAV